MIQTFKRISKVKGVLNFQGDKSISHRALLISSIADGKSIIKNLSDSDDVKSTIKCLNEFGIEILLNDETCTVSGRGFKGYCKPNNKLDAGNSGTTARLLSGILAAQNFESVIVGDESLSSRPMKRILEPLTEMGAVIESNNDKLPLKIFPSEKLNSINYLLPVASAQVKSAILFAGLHLDEQTIVVEKFLTRNHTENLLDLAIVRESEKIISRVSNRNYPRSKEYFIPGDISSAMFFIVLALLTKDSELMIKNISLNTTRTECLNILIKMGGDIHIKEIGVSNKEIFGDVIIKSAALSNVKINEEVIPLIIDEIPVLTIAGIFANGEFELRGASELRLKESDRIKAVCNNLLKVGLEVVEFEDGFRVSGSTKKLTEPFESYGDHRIAMAFAILSSLMKEGGEVNEFDCVSVSNPNFLEQLNSISA